MLNLQIGAEYAKCKAKKKIQRWNFQKLLEYLQFSQLSDKLCMRNADKLFLKRYNGETVLFLQSNSIQLKMKFVVEAADKENRFVKYFHDVLN